MDVVDGTVYLRGRVASHEEADAAAYLVESSVEADVSNELTVDPGLREGIAAPSAVDERIVPAEGEILVGDPDMLAGPDRTIESDLGRATDESVPWDPPETPRIPPTAAEERARPGVVTTGERSEEGEPGKAAADLSEADLERMSRGGPVPSLDPERDADAEAEPRADPFGVDMLGRAPDDESLDDRMPRRVPGTESGPGAVGEHVTGGGSVGSEIATQTGAAGADTAEADPSRHAGSTSEGTGTHRGPAAEDDPPLREDFPDED